MYCFANVILVIQLFPNFSKLITFTLSAKSRKGRCMCFLEQLQVSFFFLYTAVISMIDMIVFSAIATCR